MVNMPNSGLINLADFWKNSMGLERFLDAEGRVMQWPAKHEYKQSVIAYLAEKFEPGKTYHEREVNEILKQWHTFSDWPLLRRSLIDYGYMIRDLEGTEYKLMEKVND